jgi:hypothetical protein
MNQWAFVIGAYSLTSLATACLVAWAYLSMRADEAAAEQVKRRK